MSKLEDIKLTDKSLKVSIDTNISVQPTVELWNSIIKDLNESYNNVKPVIIEGANEQDIFKAFVKKIDEFNPEIRYEPFLGTSSAFQYRSLLYRETLIGIENFFKELGLEQTNPNEHLSSKMYQGHSTSLVRVKKLNNRFHLVASFIPFFDYPNHSLRLDYHNDVSGKVNKIISTHRSYVVINTVPSTKFHNQYSVVLPFRIDFIDLKQEPTNLELTLAQAINMDFSSRLNIDIKKPSDYPKAYLEWAIEVDTKVVLYWFHNVDRFKIKFNDNNVDMMAKYINLDYLISHTLKNFPY